MRQETTPLRGWGPAFSLTVLVFVAAMDQVMMPVATSAIVADFKTDAGTIQTALALVSLVAAPLYITSGKLGDIHGRKRIFLGGLIVYGIGVLAAALAPNVTILIGGWSVVRAVGMALTIPTSVSLLIASYPNDAQRGQAFAVYGVGGVAAALVGPLLMGYSTDNWNWQVPFGIQTALVVVTFALSWRFLKETETLQEASVDWNGTAIGFVAVGSLILGTMLGGRYGWWLERRPFFVGDTQVNPLGLSPAPILFGLGVLAVAFLLSRLSSMEEAGGGPLFSMRLFDSRTFIVASSMATIFFVLTGAVPFVVPVFLQQAVGFDGVQTALTMVALSIGSILLGFASGSLIKKMQPRTLMQVFLIVVVGGLVWLYGVVDLQVSVVALAVPMFVIGCGFGVISSQLPNIQLSTLPADLQGEGSGFAETGKEIGIGLGTSIVGSILFSLSIGSFIDNVARQSDISLSETQRADAILALEDEVFPMEAARQLAAKGLNLDQLAREGYLDGFQYAIFALIVIVAAALIVASFLPTVGNVADDSTQ